jgi:hypothetical protein
MAEVNQRWAAFVAQWVARPNLLARDRSYRGFSDGSAGNVAGVIPFWVITAPSLGECDVHVLTKSGLIVFSQLRLFPLLLKLPFRFETTPSRASSQVLSNTTAPSVAGASLNTTPRRRRRAA